MAEPPTDRFNEERSAFTVRGSDLPDLEAGVAAIRKTVKTLPVRPPGSSQERSESVSHSSGSDGSA